jgi:hypothetical protein
MKDVIIRALFVYRRLLFVDGGLMKLRAIRILVKTI